MTLPPRIAQLRAQAQLELDRARRLADRHPTAARSVLAAAALLAVIAFVVPLWYFVDLYRDLPDEDALARIGVMDQATTVYDSDDRLVFTIFKQRRTDVPLDGVSPHVIAAIIAIEDQRFYNHRGFDAVRTVSAALANLRQQRAAQGGSTITQQLARQSFLTADKTMRRKLQELILAFRIEARHEKDDILSLYLNKVYFGDGLYGIEAASQGYFGKSATGLSLAEAALLAGLVQSPSRYAPTANLERAVGRRNVVLQAMLETGAIDRPAWEQARAEQVALSANGPEEPSGQYFKEHVRLELVERFGWERVYQGGLRVFTTVNMAMQEAAEAAAAQALESVEERRRALEARRVASRRAAAPADPAEPQDPLQAALVAMDPATGHVRAMVGGRSFEESRFNRAVQAQRQPGSAFKPFVYAAALEAGYTPASIIDRLSDPIATLEGDWMPADGHSTADEMTLRTGLRTSSNRAAVRLLQEIGIPRAVEYAQNLGVGDVPGVPSLALGSGEVTLMSITAAYAAFANKGLVPAPIVIRRVEDREGQLLYEAKESSVRAVSETTAFLMSAMLADVVDAGTGNGARRLGFKLPAAGKTGTTNDYFDAWFIGFTPSVVTGVWMGFDQPRTIVADGYAGDVAVPLWALFMKEATSTHKPVWLRPPANVTSATVCRVSGMLAGEGCRHVDVVDSEGETARRSMAYTEYFVRGTVPTEYCRVHSRGILGNLAGLFGGGRPPLAREVDLGATQASLPPAGDQAAALPQGPAEPAVAPPAPEPPRRRGFWSRVFGIGRGGEDSDDDRQREERREGPEDREGPGRRGARDERGGGGDRGN